jgi:hypothetical protein
MLGVKAILKKGLAAPITLGNTETLVIVAGARVTAEGAYVT